MHLMMAHTLSMKALLLAEKEGLTLREVMQPSIEQDTDVIVRVTRIAICGSSLHALHRRGGDPFAYEKIRGQEFTGVIEEVGRGAKGFVVGDRMLGICTIQRGFCPECNRGPPALLSPRHALRAAYTWGVSRVRAHPLCRSLCAAQA